MIGAMIGDIVGSRFEFNNYRNKDFKLFTEESVPTDDSYQVLAMMDMLNNEKKITHEVVVEYLLKWGKNHLDAGWGTRFYYWLISEQHDPYFSYGNGSAVRAIPIGYYSKNEDDIEYLAKLVSEVTHNHEEGIKGAIVVAKCIYYALNNYSKEDIKEYVIDQYPVIESFNLEDLSLNNVFDDSCQGSVPQAVYCFLVSKDFEDCLRTSISIGGDSDTIAAISCAIAEAYYRKINLNIAKSAGEKFPLSDAMVIKEFNDRFDDYTLLTK